ncbi:hypothetical protein [Chryseobacterium sp. P1-3]|uniref:hypothetical protein n=1 Tax=Chryseobacterium sp. (strain P1-3) TaxID=1517683 RepID=UPI000AECD6BD|nr:hypothetical protein [Chryseobacterium sp. P1-3]
MRKFFIGILFFGTLGLKAQYGSLNEILRRLEERKGINQHLESVNIDNKKFIFIKDEADHTERDFIIIKGKNATYVEVFDDKATGESSSNVFTGDIVRKNNIISLRADMLENKKNSDACHQNPIIDQTGQYSVSHRRKHQRQMD